jgi:hypothetical protein
MGWCKAIGALILFACGLLVSLCAIGILRQRYQQAEAFLRLFLALREEIDRFGTPFAVALRSLSAHTVATCGISVQAGKAEELLRVPLYLSNDAIEVLAEFVRDADISPKVALLDSFNRIIDYFQKYLNALKAARSREERAALFLPLAAAATLVLILL